MTSLIPAHTHSLVQSKYLWFLSELKHPWASIRQGPVQSATLCWLPNVLTPPACTYLGLHEIKSNPLLSELA